jgi:prophage regulatory protein
MENVIMKNNASISEIGFIRLKEVLKIIPVSKSTWWAGVKSGRFPKPVKIGENTTCWKVQDIKALVEQYLNNQ